VEQGSFFYLTRELQAIFQKVAAQNRWNDADWSESSNTQGRTLMFDPLSLCVTEVLALKEA